MSAQIKAVCERLAEVNQLPLDAPTHVLQGLTKCSAPKFTGLFELMLNQEQMTQMATSVTMGEDTSQATKKGQL